MHNYSANKLQNDLADPIFIKSVAAVVESWLLFFLAVLLCLLADLLTEILKQMYASCSATNYLKICENYTLTGSCFVKLFSILF